MYPHPDNPQAVSVDFLKKLDADPPGTWLAQPKLDGWRRVLHFDGDKWTAQAKRGSEGAAKELPADVMDDLQALSVPDGTSLDCEWVGPRMVENTGGKHSLHVFDVLRFEGTWLRGETFLDRYTRLCCICCMTDLAGNHLEQIMAWKNPGLVDLFQQQMQNPLSEGLVVRRADSKLLLNPKCADNPMWFKVKYRNIKERISL